MTKQKTEKRKQKNENKKDKASSKKSSSSANQNIKAIKKASSKHPPEPQTMDELLALEKYELRGVRKADVLDGIIAAVSPREVLVDIGLKTEAVVADREMETMASWLQALKPGDKVTCYVILAENDNGQTVVSLRRAGMDNKWESLSQKVTSGEEMEVRGIDVNRGGLIVETDGLRGFIPSSQFDQASSSDLSNFINKTIRVKVIEADQEQSKLIFSQRGEEREGANEKALQLKGKIKVGEILSGEVTGVAAFGVFVKIIIDKDTKLFADGLVHISEIAWEKVDDVNKYFKVSQKVKVLVLGIDDNTGKLNLSVKQLTPDPWKVVAEKFAKDQTVTGVVSRVVNFGVFVNLAAGIDGLIHISKLPAGLELKPGEEVICLVETVDPNLRKISLSIVPTEKPMGYR